MPECQDSFTAISHALKSWLSAVNQRELVKAQHELKRIHDLMQRMRINDRYAGAWEKYSASGDTQPLDFIAAVTEAIRPGRYRGRPSSHSIQND